MNQKRLIPWILYLLFFAVLNETVFNVSTPAIRDQFALGPSSVSWMMTMFMVFFGIGAVLYGRLADLMSLRSLMSFAIVFYAGASLFGFLVESSYPLVLVARALQGIGCSALPALVFVVAARYFPPESRGRIFGLLTSTVSLAIGVGPVLGGLVSGSLHWGLLFLIPVFTLVALPFIRRELPREERKPGRVDLVGAGLVALFVGSVVVYFNFPEWGFLAGALVSGAVMMIWMLRAREPFIDLALFANKRFAAGIVVGFVLFSVVMGLLFMIPLLLDAVHGLTTTQIGLLLFPGAISSMVFGPIGGRLADKRGNSLVVALGLGLLFISLVGMAMLMELSVVVVGAALVFTYVGFSLFQTALVNSVSQTLEEKDSGLGMGIFNLVSVLSGVIGVALVGRIIDSKVLATPLFSLLQSDKSASYANLFFIFALIIVAGGVVYVRAYRKPRKAVAVVSPDNGCPEGVLAAEC